MFLLLEMGFMETILQQTNLWVDFAKWHVINNWKNRYKTQFLLQWLSIVSVGAKDNCYNEDITSI